MITAAPNGGYNFPSCEHELKFPALNFPRPGLGHWHGC